MRVSIRSASFLAMLEEAAPRLLGHVVFEDGLDKAFDRGDRRAQLVGDVGDKLAAHLFQVAKAGHVKEQDRRADELAFAADEDGLDAYPITGGARCRDDVHVQRGAAGLGQRDGKRLVDAVIPQDLEEGRPMACSSEICSTSKAERLIFCTLPHSSTRIAGPYSA